MDSRPETPPPIPSRAVEWLMIVGPILLLLPVGAPLLLASKWGDSLPEWITEPAMFVSLVTFFCLPLLVLLLPVIVLLSGAFVYEAMRDWFRRGRTGNSIVIAALWAAPTMIYGSLLVLGAIWVFNWIRP